MAQVKDPVCGMMVDSDNAEAESTYQGSTYYFCSEDCKEQFDQNPSQYVSKSSSREQSGMGTGGQSGRSGEGQTTSGGRSGSGEGGRWGQSGGGTRSDSSEEVDQTSKQTSKSTGGKGQNPGRSKGA